MAASVKQNLAAGDAVRAFYHMNDHPGNYRYVRLHGASPDGKSDDFCVVGMSTGWIPATVVEDWNPEDDRTDSRVLVQLYGQFADPYKPEPEPVHNMYWKVNREHVRRMDETQAPAEVSVLVVRWWDYWNAKNRRSRSHNVANEQMILDVLEGPGSIHGVLGPGGGYEIHTAFVRSTSDLAALERVASSMRGAQRVAMYFLWPTQRPSVERRAIATVSEPVLFRLMDGMESAGVRGCWPHPARFYRELSGKLWIPRVCQSKPHLQVMPTLAIDAEGWRKDPRGSAEGCIAQLMRMREPSSEPANDGPYRGVLKLGFSWMGEDVRPFSGVDDLAKGVLQMTDGAEGSPVCLVQERLENVVCELRAVCCRDRASGPTAFTKELVWMTLHPPRHDDTFSLTSHQTMTRAEAIDLAFKGNADAAKIAEEEVERLTDAWFQWFLDEGFGTPGACRLDFIVAFSSKVTVRTVELSECGASLCGLPHAARTVAALNECLDVSGARAPLALPPLRAPVSPQKRDEGSRMAQQLVPSRGGIGAFLKACCAKMRGRAMLALLIVFVLFRLKRRRFP